MEDKKSVMGHLTVVPNPEVPEKTKPRRFTAAYRLSILKEVESFTGQGQICALLRRREGLYSSNLTLWRRQRNNGFLPKKRGPQKPYPDIRCIAELERENAKLNHKFKQAELIIEVQKKVAELLKGSNGEKS